MNERRQGKSRAPGLVAIASFKFFKTIVLFFVACAALNIARGTWLERLAVVAPRLELYPAGKDLHAAVERLFQVRPGEFIGAAIASALYGAVFLVEGVGLWMMKPWAEYLTLATSAGFIPLEILELTQSQSPARWAMLGVNVAIVVYLVLRVRTRRRAERRAPARPLATDRVVTTGAHH